MISNSAIFTTSVAKNSGLTAEQLTTLGTNITAQYLNQSNASNMRTKLPSLPSDQRVAKDK